ncbi:unnamed protein product [Prunus armeniaca]|uniref:Uncharacterized protein n=1 Tax=Prunus armeniaca TaxID=36596 RepID=A0A6J5X4H6_PRUAR|nr:unnamed protein product [Prunus armeniaca]CAB4308739.1 unnamed protein product [Prunus armeniaca]
MGCLELNVLQQGVRIVTPFSGISAFCIALTIRQGCVGDLRYRQGCLEHTIKLWWFRQGKKVSWVVHLLHCPCCSERVIEEVSWVRPSSRSTRRDPDSTGSARAARTKYSLKVSHGEGSGLSTFLAPAQPLGCLDQ